MLKRYGQIPDQLESEEPDENPDKNSQLLPPSFRRCPSMVNCNPCARYDVLLMCPVRAGPTLGLAAAAYPPTMALPAGCVPATLEMLSGAGGAEEVDGAGRKRTKN